MKRVLIIFKPVYMATLSLLIVTIFLRIYLYENSNQLVKEFKNQNFKEIYSLDTLKITSRLNALSSAINWVCIEASVNGKSFYRIERGDCKTGLFQHSHEIYIKEANNIRFVFTTKLPKEVGSLFSLYWALQLLLIFALIVSTRKAEEVKRQHEIKNSKLARQMSHDIRSPLAALNTILHESKIVSGEQMVLLEKSLERINQISNSLLSQTYNANSFVVEKLQSPKISDCNVVQIVSEIVREKRVEYGELKFISIITSFEKEIMIASVDEFELKRIISNLLNNSIEAKVHDTPLNIKIVISKVKNNLSINICDDGQGIPEIVMKKLGTSEVTTKKVGNGLGLLHSFESVKSWNGRVLIESKSGVGTSIQLELPYKIYKALQDILLDDDELVRLTWESVAKRKNINFVAYANPSDLYKDIEFIDRSSRLYIDSLLGNDVKGEDIAADLFQKGFKEIYITSGFNKEFFNHLTFIRDVRDKRPPWV